MEDYHKRVRELRHSPMIEAWIATYRARGTTHKDCHRCGYPHYPNILCGMGAQFGQLNIGRDWYSIDTSNVVFFHDFMLSLGQGGGFHWRDETFFKRVDGGAVEVRYIEQYNNSPQIKTWTIPPNEWASIVCSVSNEGETGERWNAAQDFHGRLVTA